MSKIAVDNMTFKVVLTLPANWDHPAQELTRQAAEKAGIKKPRFRGPTTFKTMSEPEAAALAAWKEALMRWRPDLKLGDSFVVCDAGDGTVDLISYTVKSLEPALKLEMCVEATGALCGAVYLDERFESHIPTEVGSSTYDKLSEEVKARVFENDWEFSGKKKYNGQDTEFHVDIPGYKPKRPGFFGKKPSSTIILKGGHMNAIFQPVVGQVIDLVRTQVQEVHEETQNRPKAVLLVGGFGENNYLLKQIQATFKGIDIQRPTNSWSVISRGAVIKGLSVSPETETVTNFISKLSYGVKHNSYFRPYFHDERDKYRCPLKGVDMARDQFTWYLKRGTSVSKLDPVRYQWLVSLRSIHELEKVHGEVWISDQKTPPTRLDSNAKRLCKINCNFDSGIFYDLEEKQVADSMAKYRELSYTLKMKVAAGELEWIIYWQDQQKGAAQVNVEYE
ncbi:hypothetical protein HYALB_00008997 [Hymenoscyphus albidus]|uniref:Actin-like ATPase domain-containing protein n=1 Tax=Hymenoscyphus albidus TaxID=595503 RepID=A0A9N9LSJ0_9HELO|nr:hypothetical protein HYALB_00008997 [Hymenoscyphus albidus]